MFAVFACICFLSTTFCTQAEDRQACSSLLDGTCDEGLEMLQSTAKKLSPPPQPSGDDEKDAPLELPSDDEQPQDKQPQENEDFVLQDEDKKASDQEEQAKDKEELPAGWASAVDPETHKPYYYKEGSKKSQWEKPVAADDMESGDRRDDSIKESAEDKADKKESEKKVKTEETVKKVKPAGDDTWDKQMKEQDKIDQKKADAKELDIDFEKDELKEQEFNRIRFRARHQDWIDILDLYSDGFMQRYHDHDSGTWRLKDNKLVLKWLRWGEDELGSADDGISFNASKTMKKQLHLKSYWQPAWWKNWFKIEDKHKNDAKLNDMKEDEAGVSDGDVARVIGDHINGKNADLSEQGYAAVATLKSNKEMENFVRRVAEKMNLAITNEGGLEGMVPYYSGVQSTQSFGQMVVEMKKNSQSSPRWLWDRSA